MIMEAQEHIALTIQRHYGRVTASIARGFGIWDYIELEMQQCIEMIENHTREVKELMRSAESTRRLVHHTGIRTAKPLNSRKLLIAFSFSKFWIIATII